MDERSASHSSHKQLFVADMIMSVFELALVMKVATCCLLYRGHVVPKDVCVALALTVCVRGDVPE